MEDVAEESEEEAIRASPLVFVNPMIKDDDNNDNRVDE